MEVSTRPRLANSPLYQVVFEVKFPGSFALVNGLDRFQNAIRNEYPRLFVPKAEPGQFPALTPFRFSSPDDSSSINVAINLFSLMVRSYGVFAEFRAEFERLYRVFRQTYDPSEFTRMGLRYINLLPPVPADLSSGAIPLHPWLNVALSVPAGLVRPFTSGLANFVLEYPHGKLRMVIGNAELEEATKKDVFVLDLDFFRDERIPATEMFGFLDQAHRTIEDTFFGLLRPEIMKDLEGGD